MNEPITGRPFAQVWAEVRVKVLVVVASAVILTTGSLAVNWAQTNVVFASDLEGLADMIAADVAQALQPLTQAVQQTNALSRQNAEDIRTFRVQAVRGQIRDLQAQIAEMEKRRAAGDAWTPSDTTLLQILRDDLEELEALYDDLTDVPRIP